MARTELPATVTFERGTVRLKWEPAEWPHVTVVIPTRHNRPMVVTCARRSRGHRLPGPRRRRRRQRRTHRRQRAVVRRDVPRRSPLAVEWWTKPFNYSAVNNAGADGRARRDPRLPERRHRAPRSHGGCASWSAGRCSPTSGWSVRSSSTADGRIQHGGVILGLSGFADHLFQGMRPDSPSMFGPTSWYRNVLAVTGACLAVRRSCSRSSAGWTSGSSCGQRCRRSVSTQCIRGYAQRLHAVHRRAAPRVGDAWHRIPACGLLRQLLALPALGDRRRPVLLAQPVALEPRPRSCAPASSRPRPADVRARSAASSRVFRQSSDGEESITLANMYRVTDADVARSRRCTPTNRARSRSSRSTGSSPTSTARSTAASTPRCGSPITCAAPRASRTASCSGRRRTNVLRPVRDRRPLPGARETRRSVPRRIAAPALDRVPPADARSRPVGHRVRGRAIHATRTAQVLPDPGLRADVLPRGHALRAGRGDATGWGCTASATPSTARTLRGSLRRQGDVVPARRSTPPSSTPNGRVFERTVDQVATVFVYARPGHWRNCWELASLALEELKDRLGDRRAHRHRRLVGPARRPRHRHRAPRPARLPRHRRPLPHVRRRCRARRSPSTRRTCRWS